MKEKKDMEINPDFLNFNSQTVNVSTNKVYIPADTRGRLMVESIEYRDGYTGKSLIFSYRVVSCEPLSTTALVARPGDIVSSVKKIGDAGKKGDAQRSGAITEIVRIAGFMMVPDKSQFAALVTRATSADQPFTGFYVDYSAPISLDKAGNPKLGTNGQVLAFPNFFPVPEENTPAKVAARLAGKNE